jgi:hypothetical protein
MSGAICHVGYSTDHYFKTRGLCAVCEKRGALIYETGWVGSMVLHASKECRGYFELSDGYLLWKRQVDEQDYDSIVQACERALLADKEAEDATGRKCHTCETTRGVHYYGMRPDPMIAFCKPHHKAWVFSPAYYERQKAKVV